MERLRVQENGHTGQEPSSGVIIPDQHIIYNF